MAIERTGSFIADCLDQQQPIKSSLDASFNLHLNVFRTTSSLSKSMHDEARIPDLIPRRPAGDCGGGGALVGVARGRIGVEVEL